MLNCVYLFLFALLTLTLSANKFEIKRGPSITRKTGKAGLIPVIQQEECGPCIRDEMCIIHPGESFPCIRDFTATTSTSSLSLLVDVYIAATLEDDNEYCVQIMDLELPNSEVEEGVSYFARFYATPNDTLSKKRVQFRGSIVHTDTRFVELCASIDCYII
ncbi:uncharacterized protein LOC110863529 [Folsomia candida]|uniref:uncharacterized protein LOC110863529 n=1 Tax=Folsomia candida TaxID=158441 RepID=UPI000B8F5877|nr:uncharacterized protein LOC110863529 [Folsomia candida]